MPELQSQPFFTEAEKQQMREEFRELGFTKQVILNAAEIEELRTIYAQVLNTQARSQRGASKSSSLQHLGDQLEDFASEAKHYYFHILTTPGTQALHHVYYHPKIQAVVETLLGADLIINNASMLAANPGTVYNLGWHRDVIQIPEDEIRDELFSEQRHHNSCQINLPLYEEACLQVVPASHRRPNTAAENKAFAGTKHYAPLDAEMPGAEVVSIAAGSALFYNNNLIHRGYHAGLEQPRRTLHMGFHSARRKPTWHFYLLNPADIDEEYVQTLDPSMQQMMADYLDCYRQYPHMEDTWKAGWDGNP